MKKTTIYLEDYELEILKQKAFLLKTSVAELIRKGVGLILKPSSKEEDLALNALSNIRKKSKNLNVDTLMQDIVTTQREIRNEKKNQNRS